MRGEARAVGQRADGGAREGENAGQQLVENDTRGVQVGRGSRGLAAKQLGRHVAGRPDGGPRFGQTAGVDSSDSEVGDLELPVCADEDVARLDVAMHDAVRVRATEGLEKLPNQGAGLTDAHPGCPHVLGKRDPGHVFHDDVRRPLLLAAVVDRHDARVGHAPCRRRLATKAFDDPGCHLGLQERSLDRLQRDDSVDAGIVRLVHDAHGPSTDHPEEPVTP